MVTAPRTIMLWGAVLIWSSRRMYGSAGPLVASRELGARHAVPVTKRHTTLRRARACLVVMCGPRVRMCDGGRSIAVAAGADELWKLVPAAPSRVSSAPAGVARRSRCQARQVHHGRGRRPEEDSRPAPSPEDWGKPDSKSHVLCDRGGLPPSIALSAANGNDAFARKPLVGTTARIRSRWVIERAVCASLTGCRRLSFRYGPIPATARGNR